MQIFLLVEIIQSSLPYLWLLLNKLDDKIRLSNPGDPNLCLFAQAPQEVAATAVGILAVLAVLYQAKSMRLPESALFPPSEGLKAGFETFILPGYHIIPKLKTSVSCPSCHKTCHLDFHPFNPSVSPSCLDGGESCTHRWLQMCRGVTPTDGVYHLVRTLGTVASIHLEVLWIDGMHM